MADIADQDALAQAKQQLRRRLRRWRREYAPTDTGRRSSAAVCAHIAALPEWQNARTVALYKALRGEVDVAALASSAVRVCWPVVVARGQPLEWRLGGDWQPGPFGILEPGPEAAVVDPQDIDLVVVPGVAFDQGGRRLGHGGGFYDRSLRAMSALRVAVGFAGQVVQRVPTAPTDELMDLLVTEHGAVRPLH